VTLAFTLIAGCSSFSMKGPPTPPVDDPLAWAIYERGTTYEEREQISELNRKKDWDGLLRFALALIREDPGGSDGGVLAGYAFLRSRDYSRAVASLSQVVKQNPEDVGAWNLLGEAQRRAGQPGQAARTLEQASVVGRTSYVTFFFLGEAYRDAQRLYQAIPAYREAVRLEPEFAQGWVELGAASAKMGNREDFARALAVLSKLDKARAEELKKRAADRPMK
jgi:tetratricopeptide (TPR) repeat protein